MMKSRRHPLFFGEWKLKVSSALNTMRLLSRFVAKRMFELLTSILQKKGEGADLS